MYTLGTVLTRLRHLVTSAIFNALELIQRLLSNSIGALTTIKTRFADSLINLWYLRVQIRLKLKAYRAQFITLVSSTKAEPTAAQHKVTVPGRQRVRTARKTRQPAKAASKKGK